MNLLLFGIILGIYVLGILIAIAITNTWNIKPLETTFKLIKDSGIGIPIIKVTQKNHKYYFLIDTGSEHSTIHPDVLDVLEYTKREDISTMVYDVNGNISGVPIITTDFKLSNKYGFRESFQVFNFVIHQNTKVKISGLLGSSFLRDNKLIIDYDNYILRKL